MLKLVGELNVELNVESNDEYNEDELSLKIVELSVKIVELNGESVEFNEESVELSVELSSFGKSCSCCILILLYKKLKDCDENYKKLKLSNK